MATNTINLKCELNVEDAIAWNNYYLENSAQWIKNWKLIRFVFMPVMVICFLLGVIYLLVNPLYLSTVIAGGIGIILGGGGFLYLFFYPNTLHRRIRKTAQKAYSYRNSLVGNHQYAVSTAGIVDNDNDIVKWTAVEDIVQTDTHIFILVRPKKAVIIPKRAFPDSAAIDRFVTNVKAIYQTAQKTA
ncbi:MAG: YcxB family protein [Dehalococcoidales bacterium]